MSRTEKEYIRFLRYFAGEGLKKLAFQVGVDAADGFARLAFALHEGNFNLRMVEQNPDKFACRVACSADDAGFQHG